MTIRTISIALILIISIATLSYAKIPLTKQEQQEIKTATQWVKANAHPPYSALVSLVEEIDNMAELLFALTDDQISNEQLISEFSIQHANALIRHKAIQKKLQALSLPNVSKKKYYRSLEQLKDYLLDLTIDVGYMLEDLKDHKEKIASKSSGAVEDLVVKLLRQHIKLIQSENTLISFFRIEAQPYDHNQILNKILIELNKAMIAVLETLSNTITSKLEKKNYKELYLSIPDRIKNHVYIAMTEVKKGEAIQETIIAHISKQSFDNPELKQKILTVFQSFPASYEVEKKICANFMDFANSLESVFHDSLAAGSIDNERVGIICNDMQIKNDELVKERMRIRQFRAEIAANLF